jgi:DNA-binding transcriptional ArsR family regulator
MSDELPDTFTREDIEFEMSKEAKKAVTDVEFVRDPDRAAELDDSVRVQILKVLREGIADTITSESRDEDTGDRIIRQREVKRHALSVVEIVKLSPECVGCDEITKNQVYHHMPKLIDAGFVIKFGTVTKGNRTTDYYRRTSKGFVIATAHLATEHKKSRRHLTEYVEAMSTSFNLDVSEEQKKEIVELWAELYTLQSQGRAKVVSLIKGDVADKQVLKQYDSLVELYSFGNDRVVEIFRRMRSIVFPED